MVWFGKNRKKISQIIKDYFHLPFFLLIILCFVYLAGGEPGVVGNFWWSPRGQLLSLLLVRINIYKAKHFFRSWRTNLVLAYNHHAFYPLFSKTKSHQQL
jgi:hypothetical protein